MSIGMAAPALAADLAAGESVFSNNCAACHSGGGNVVEPAKTLEKEVTTGGRSIQILNRNYFGAPLHDRWSVNARLLQC